DFNASCEKNWYVRGKSEVFLYRWKFSASEPLRMSDRKRPFFLPFLLSPLRKAYSMGRRAVRPVNPTLDLSRHFKTFDDLPQPWDAARLFERDLPLEVEVGSGKGLFIQNAATAHP